MASSLRVPLPPGSATMASAVNTLMWLRAGVVRQSAARGGSGVMMAIST